MADQDTVMMGKLNYWLREKHFNHVINTAREGIQKYGNDPVLKFFQAFGSIMTADRLSEGMRELATVKDKRDLNICSYMALIYGHRKAKTIDREAITELDAKLKDERKQAGEKGLYFGGLIMFHLEKLEKAKEYTDRALRLNGTSKEALALRGWIELMLGKAEAGSKKPLKYFDECLAQEGSRDIDAMFGKARYQEFKKNYVGAIDLYNQAFVAYPNFIPGLVEKMKAQLYVQDWEQSVETAQRASSIDSNCILSHVYSVLHNLCREGNYPDAASKISDLTQIMDREEPRNSTLFFKFAKAFSRLGGRNPLVLQQTYYMAERAMTSEQGNAEYVNELGHQLLMQGKVKDALKCFRNAMKIEETSVTALTGIIRCQLMEGQIEDAAQQIEFLNEIQQTIGSSKMLSYLSAVLASKRLQPSDNVMELLVKTVEKHFADLRGIPLGIDYFIQLDPDFLVDIVKEFLTSAPTKPLQQGQPPDPVLRRCVSVLEPLCRTVPGLLEALYLMSKVKFLSGEIDAAQATLQHCLDQDSAFADGHILMAQIHLHQNSFQLANQSLEVGLSYNFEVREHPLYHLIKARILKKQGDLTEAVKLLQTAMTLPGVKTSGSRLTSGPNSKKAINISTNDRVSVFLELAEAHRQLDEPHEAAKVMQDAINEFQGTGEEVRITISNVDLALTRGDIEGALAMLRSVQPEEPYYVQAREKMAQIYLHHRKDKRLYASCYRELVDKYPSVHTCLLLGDAYMSIQEPERAIEVYEAALKKNPREPGLASKIGQALIKTHNYGKAINYYEHALKTGTQQFLRHDLAELLIKLKQHDKAEKILKQVLESETNPTALDQLIEHTKYYTSLAKVYQKRNNAEEESLTQLNKARDMQTRVLKRAQVEQPDVLPAQKQLAASICVKLAQLACQQRDFEKGIRFYKEALSHTESDGKIMLELSKLYLTTEDLDACQHQCMTLLKNDTENDAATVMLADLMFRKNEYEQATYHFQQLLSRKPDHYEALARLVDLLRRAGKLEDIPKFLETAENNNPRALMDGGFNYCKGLYEWYTGDANAALMYFNKARHDADFSLKAMSCMLEICINPDNMIVGGEVFEGGDDDSSSDKHSQEQVASMATASRLVKDFHPKPTDIRGLVLQNMVLVSSKNKSLVEQAIQAMTELNSQEPDHIGCLYGLAAAYMVIKQNPRARNYLKRCTKNTWTYEDAEDLEKSWLLLSDIYIQSGKYDMASELLKRCLQYNKSCCKAYEYMGYIMEKEQSYKDASRNYELAWKYGNQRVPQIGYKLSFNYLKAKRYVDAIDICHSVLKTYPQYPKIRKEVLEKARASIRV